MNISETNFASDDVGRIRNLRDRLLNQANTTGSEKDGFYTACGITDIEQIVAMIADLEFDKHLTGVVISQLKKDAFSVLKEKRQGTEWTKAGLNEAFRLMKYTTEERNTALSQANMILRQAGKSEIDLGHFC